MFDLFLLFIQCASVSTRNNGSPERGAVTCAVFAQVTEGFPYEFRYASASISASSSSTNSSCVQ